MSTTTSIGADGRHDGVRWIKSSYSGPTGGNCVEVAFLADGDVAVRNSRHRQAPALVFTRTEWAAFVSGAQNGEFGIPD